MDYIIFHSQFSPSSKKIFEEFPAMREKAVSIDTVQMRTYAKHLHIVCVPTMVIILGNKIIDRIVGYDKISNWIILTLYRTNQINPVQEIQEAQTIPQSPTPPVQVSYVQPEPEIPQQQTSLDTLILTDETPQENEINNSERMEPKISGSGSVSTLQRAEALKKERDGDLENNNKKRTIN